MMHDNRLMDIILDNIDYTEYNLNEDEKKWIYKFINESPETFIELDTDIKTITEDKSIKIDDITTIIKIIADTYYCALCKNNSLNSNNLPNFIKYTIHVILDSELLILSTNDDKERLNNIIDSSMILLNMNLTVDRNEYNKKNCFNCFYNYSFFDLIIKQLKKY